MEFNFENQGTNTYLVYAVKAEDEIDTMSLGMITNNKIPGLASTVFTQMDTTKYIKYNVSAHISAKQFFSGVVNKKRLVGVFSGIVNAMLSAEDYMIDTNSILLDLDYIFADVSTCETVLVCLPLKEVEQNPVDLCVFFKNIVFSTQFDQTENCDYVAKIINYLNSTPMFSLNDFKGILDRIQNQNIVSNTSNSVHKNTQPAVHNTTVNQTSVKTVTQSVVNTNPVSVAQTVKADNMKTAIPAEPVQKVQQTQKQMNIPASNSPAFKIPGNLNAQSVQKATDNATKPVAEPVEKMSMFYLLQHYNKENAAAYKAQKEAKKQQKTGNAIPNVATANSENNIPAKSNFAVPQKNNQQMNSGFAIPGQQIQNNVQNQTAVQSVVPTQTAAVSPSTLSYQTQTQTQFVAQSMNFGETTVLGGGMIGETTVLGATNSTVSQEKPYLVRCKNNERINLDKPVFRIGKEKSYVDYFIGDNSAISRSHANLITREGKYFVLDTNSTNHTFVNGSMISSNVEVEVKHGTKIKFANEEFEFKLF